MAKGRFCCLIFGVAMICGQVPPQPGACQAQNDDIVFAQGASARGPQFDYPIISPMYTASRATFFRVTRVVGPGLPTEFASGTPGAIASANWPVYTQNGVVSTLARVEVSSIMVIDPAFYYNTHLLGGNDPVNIVASVTFTLNGTAIAPPIIYNVTVTSPTPIEQSVDLCVSVDASLLRFAGRLVDPSTKAGISCADQQQGETTCPGINEVEAFTQVNYGTSGLNFVNQATRIMFKAMAPVVLIGGCCVEHASFWGSSTNSGDFLYGLAQRHVPYSTRSEIDSSDGVVFGSIEQGAGQLNVQIPKVAREFGSPWVNLVAHSKGGLNARYLLGTRWLESQGIGALSLTTLDTPHLGALGAEIIDQRALGNQLQVNNSPAVTATLNAVAQTQAEADRCCGTIPDLTPAQVQGHLNDIYVLPPVDNTVNSVKRPLRVRALASDANVDGSTLHGGPDTPTNMDWRTISFFEGRNLTGTKGQTINAPEVMYNMEGTVTGLTPSGQTRTGPDGKRITIINPCYGQTFQWNDCVVTVNSQSYAASYFSSTPFTSLTSPQPIAQGAPHGNNHNSLSNSDIAALVAGFLQSITQ